jgi:hypothetical protein
LGVRRAHPADAAARARDGRARGAARARDPVPWVWTAALRLASLALALAVVVFVCARTAPTLGRAGKRTLWLSALFLWFLPMLTSRFTSENWGGLALAAAVPLLEADGPRRRDYGAGFLLGLAFVLRFQMRSRARRSSSGCWRKARTAACARSAWSRARCPRSRSARSATPGSTVRGC